MKPVLAAHFAQCESSNAVIGGAAMKRCRAWQAAWVVFWLMPLAAGAADGAVRYVTAYPAADQFCPPVAGYFDEVQRTLDRVGTRTFTHQPNGGYGLPVQDKVGDAHLIHLGADVGWYRTGDPVFAVANGVVRISEGPPIEEKKAKSRTDAKADGTTKSGAKGKSPVVLSWGNLVVVEHRLPDGKYATTVYGHLANERLVKAGDIVRVGQPIGTIGTARVNGGYKPHLHFGVRPGRMVEAGRKLIDMNFNGRRLALTIVEVGEDKLLLSGGEELPERVGIAFGDETFELVRRDGKTEAPLALLTKFQPTGFPIVGYALSVEGWEDPTMFLRQNGAETAPAAFEVAEQQRPRTRPTRRKGVE
jgi:hypothetical protein